MRRFLTLTLVIVVLGLFGAALTAPAQAQDAAVPAAPPVRTVTDDEVNTIAQTLYCPVCENITLDTCGTAACADWRYEIRLQLEQGLTQEQITEDFVRRFGDRVVGTPHDPILRALALFTPWLAIAGALVAVAYILSRRRPVSPVSAVPTAGVSVPPGINGHTGPSSRYLDQFEQDLKV